MNARKTENVHARTFRQGRCVSGKGDLSRALEVLNDGKKIAEREGDRKWLRGFATEMLAGRKHRNLSKTSIPFFLRISAFGVTGRTPRS